MSSTTVIVNYTPGHIYRVLRCDSDLTDGTYYADFTGPTFNRLIAKELILETFESRQMPPHSECDGDLKIVYPSYSADDSKPAEKVDHVLDGRPYYTNDGMLLLLSTIAANGHGIVSGDQGALSGRPLTVTFNDAETHDCYDWLASRIAKIKKTYRYIGSPTGPGYDNADTIAFAKPSTIHPDITCQLVQNVSDLDRALYMSIYRGLDHQDGYGHETTDIIKDNFRILEAFRDHPYLNIMVDISYMVRSVEDVMVPDYCWYGVFGNIMTPEDEEDENYEDFYPNGRYTRDEETVNQWKDSLRYFFNGYGFDEKIDTINTAPVKRLWSRIRLFTFAKPLDTTDPKDIRYSLDRSFVENFDKKNASHAQRKMLKMLYGRGIVAKTPRPECVLSSSIKRSTFEIFHEALTHTNPNKILSLSPLLAFVKFE